MEFPWKNIFLLVIYGLLQMAAQAYWEPTLQLQEFINATCPPERPNKCPPHVLCHDYEHYCRRGVLEPCFPSDIFTNYTAMLEFCLQSVNRVNLPHATCQCSCSSVIAKHYINLISKQVVESTFNENWSVNSCFPRHITDNESLLDLCRQQITNNWLMHPSCEWACITQFGSRALLHSPLSQNGNAYDYPWILCLAFLILSILANIVLSVLVYKVIRERNLTMANNVYAGEDKSSRKINSMENVNDKEENVAEHETPPTGTPPTETPPAAVIIDSCRNIKQTSFNDSNSIPIVNLLPVEATSSNRVNEDSLNQSDQNHGTSNIQDEQTRYDSQCESSIVVYVRRGVSGTSEELAALIPGNEITTSADSFSQGQVSTGDLSFYCNPAMPKAEGQNGDITITNE